ncbi:MAG: hypothetical protein ACRD0P_21600, partial [Stackebrandtia sp.]
TLVRPADVRFYFDADVLGLAKTVCRLRSDMTYPGDPGATIKRRERPPCVVVSPAVKDPVWIRQVAREGWLIITRDKRIRDHPAELRAVTDAGAKMVTLASADARDAWSQLEILMSQWRGIDRLVSEEGPFIYTASRTVLNQVSLGDKF